MLARRIIPLPIPPPFSATVDHDDLSAYTAGAGGTVSTITVTVTASGGAGGYTYAWPASGGGITTSNPTSASTHWTYTGHGIASWAQFDFTCAVTDLLGKVSYVTVRVRCQAGGDPP